MPVSYVLGLALIGSSIWKWGAFEVRGYANEVFLLTLLGFVGLLIAVSLFSWLGISISDDIIERRNPAALTAMPAAILALSAIFAGGYLGEGPSYWNNIFSAALGISAFFLLWVCLELAGRISISISEERDMASGIRFAGYALATGGKGRSHRRRSTKSGRRYTANTRRSYRSRAGQDENCPHGLLIRHP